MSKRSNKSKKSSQWLNKQNQDPYIIKSRKEGYRSRAAYKLLEINEKDHILKPGMIVIELGSAPGGWSQVVSKLVGSKGRVIAIDLLPMEPIQNQFDNVEFIQGDFTTDEIRQKLASLPCKIDLVISDMAPNLTGIKTVDQANSVYLVELAYTFAKEVLKKNGAFLAKSFNGAGFDGLLSNIKSEFSSVAIRKPNASRSESNEVYLLARGYT